MPSAPGRVCRCGGIVRDGVCDRCGPKRGRVQHTKSRHERGYDNAWEKLSKRRREEEPFCLRCIADGRASMVTSTHHIEKIKDAPDKRLDEENTMPSCTPCHAYLDALYEQSRAQYWSEIERIRDAVRLERETA